MFYLLITNMWFVPVKAVQLCDQGEGSALVVSQGRPLPPAGQCGHYSAALPCHPQYNIPEQGEL